jgi:hypothetical protein
VSPKQVVVIDFGFVRWRNLERDSAGAHAIFGKWPAIPGEWRVAIHREVSCVIKEQMSELQDAVDPSLEAAGKSSLICTPRRLRRLFFWRGSAPLSKIRALLTHG